MSHPAGCKPTGSLAWVYFPETSRVILRTETSSQWVGTIRRTDQDGPSIFVALRLHGGCPRMGLYQLDAIFSSDTVKIRVNGQVKHYAARLLTESRPETSVWKRADFTCSA